MATVSEFPKMGDYPNGGDLVDLSSRPSPYTMPQPRHRSGGADVPGVGSKSNRSASEVSGKRENFPTFPKLYEQNAACATEGQRNIRVMPRYNEQGGFWDQRGQLT